MTRKVKNKRRLGGRVITPKQDKVVDLLVHKKRKWGLYEVDVGPEWLSAAYVKELVRQGKWMGTYTPPAAYGRQPKEDKDGEAR